MDEIEREIEREARDTRGDLGGSDAALIAEYDIATQPERRHGERRAAQESEAEEGAVRPWSVTGRAEGGHVDVRGISGMTRADEANVSGLSAITMGRKTKLTGGTPVAVASGEVEIEKGASFVALAGRKVEVEDHGYLGVAVAPRVEVQDGGRVLISAVSALVAGLAFGVGFAATALIGVSAMRRRGLVGRMRARAMMRSGALGRVARGSRMFGGGMRG